MGRHAEPFQPTNQEVKALQAAWQELQRIRDGERQFGAPSRANRHDFSALRKALTSLQKALVPFESTDNDLPTGNRMALIAHLQGHALARSVLLEQSRLDDRLTKLANWLPDLVEACDPETRGPGASFNPGAFAWIACSMAHWEMHTGKKPGSAALSRYVRALLSMQDREPWPKVTEGMIRTAAREVREIWPHLNEGASQAGNLDR
jgi:hypothetical protein